MAGMEGFPGVALEGGRAMEGPSLYWDQKTQVPQFEEGDPRRPSTLSGRIRGTKGYQVDENIPEVQGETDKYAGLGIGFAGLIAENLVCHPFTILRRQCQVNVDSVRYHRTPFTLLPVVVNLNRWQGVAVLWKGIGSSLTIKGLTLGVEDCLSKFTPWPKKVDAHSSLKMIGQNLLLKAVATAVITPFYSASLVETVQSDIASEKPGIFDVFREGIMRLVSWSDPRCGRMLPVWVLIPPQVLHSLCHYIISTIISTVWLQVLKVTHRSCQKLKGAVSKDPQLGNLPGLSEYQEHAAALTGHFAAEAILYPFETVLHRLHLQGTRSIIDNLDTGREVVPILTRYEGVTDCFNTVLQQEGFSGLFKGFGAVILQYTVHFLIIKFSSKIISQVAQVFGHPSNSLKDQVIAAYGDKMPEPTVASGSPAGAASLRGSPRGSPAPSPLRTKKDTESLRQSQIKDEQSPLARPSHALDEISPLVRQSPAPSLAQTPLAATPVAGGGFPPLFSNASSPRKMKFEREFDGLGSSVSSTKNWRSFDNL